MLSAGLAAGLGASFASLGGFGSGGSAFGWLVGGGLRGGAAGDDENADGCDEKRGPLDVLHCVDISPK